MKYITLILLVLLIPNTFFGNQVVLDSTEIKLNNLLTKTASLVEMESYFKICFDLEQNGDFNRALNYYNKLKGIAESKNDKLLLARCYLRIGLVSTNLSKYNDAFDSYNKAILIVENNSSDSLYVKLHADILNNTGSAFDNIANYDKAVEYYIKSIKISERFSDTIRIIKASMNIGASLYMLRKYDKALNYYESAYKLAKLKNSKLYMSVALYNIGTAYSSKENYTKALEYYNQVLKAFEEMDEKIQVGRILMWGGQIYLALENYDKAFELYNKSIEIAKEFNDELGSATCYLRLAEYYNKTKDYKNAIKNSLSSLEYFEKNDIQSWMINNYDILSDTYYKLGNYKSGYDYIKKSNVLKDSISKRDISSLVSNFEISQEFEKNNRKIELIQKDNQIKVTQTNNIIYLLLTTFIALLIILLLLYSRYRLKNKLNRQLTDLNSTKDKFFTIISHDLRTPISSFNNLAGILSDYYNDLTEQEKVKHLKSLKESSANIMVLLENLLTWSRMQTEKISVSPENIDIPNLIDIEILNQKQFADKKNITIASTVQSELYAFADKDMISTVVRNLLSNAIKYAPLSGKITISANKHLESVKINFADTGIGIKEEDKTKLFKIDIKHSSLGTANEKGTGLGLNLCKEFVERNNGNISFESQIGIGSTFSFTLPNVE